MADIVTIGEIIVDLTAIKGTDGEISYLQCAGGAPANVAVMASKLGASSAFIGKTGSDMFGGFLLETLKKHGVSADGVIIDRERRTPLAFVKLDENGEREFCFYRENSADTALTYEDVNRELIDDCRIFHFGSLLLASEPSKSATVNAVEYAKSCGKIISYDPNFRKSMWESEEKAISTMRSMLKYCDVLKIAETELDAISDCNILLKSLADLFKYGISVVILTQGAKGCVIASKKGIERLPTYDVQTIDTIGAGDSFFGAFLTKLAQSGKRPDELSMAELVDFADFANACGALSSTKHGAIPSMPTLQEVLDCMKLNDKLLH